MKNIKAKLIDIADAFYLKFTGHRMSPMTRRFIINLSWSFYSGIIAMPATLLIATIAGRMMGPEEFGKYNLVLVISSYLVIFIFLGLDISTIKNIAKTKSTEQQSRSFFSSLLFVILNLIILTIIYIFFGYKIADIFKVQPSVILFAVFYTYAASAKAIVDSLVRGREMFKTQSIGKIVEAIVLMGGFVVIILIFSPIDFRHYLLSVFIGALATLIYYISLGEIRSHFNSFSLNELKEQLAEGKFFMLSGLFTTIFISSDRLLVARYIDVKTLGIYSAYYLASLGIVLAISKLFTNVLLPTAAKVGDKSFVRDLNKISVKSAPITFLLLLTSTTVLMFIFGGEYTIKLTYLLLFASAACLYFYQSLYAAVIVDAGRKIYAQYFYTNSVINFITIGMYVVVFKGSFADPIVLILIIFCINMVISMQLQQIFIKKMAFAPTDLKI